MGYIYLLQKIVSILLTKNHLEMLFFVITFVMLLRAVDIVRRRQGGYTIVAVRYTFLVKNKWISLRSQLERSWIIP